MSASQQPKRIAIVGAGISGLVAAFKSSKIPNAETTLFEASDRLGGVLRTTMQNGFLIEHSADNFISNEQHPWALQFCEEIGFANEIISTNEQHRRAMIWWNGRLYPVPDGFQLMKTSDVWAILRSPLLSWRGKTRLLAERFVSKKDNDDDESLADFAVRRLGREAFERLVQPLVSGIYTADARRLSMNAALPQFVQMEQQFSSLANAVRAQRRRDRSSGARYNQFFAPRHGMESFVSAITRRLDDVTIRREYPIDSIHFDRATNRWKMTSVNGSDDWFDAVVLCVPTHRAATLMKHCSADLSVELGSIEHASSAVVCLGYRRDQFARPLEAFGCVIPEQAGRRIIAVSFSSVKFPDRAPPDQHLLRVFVGGALHPEYAHLPESDLIDLATGEVRDILGVSGQPTLSLTQRWIDTMPQYHLNHLERVAKIRELSRGFPRLEFVSNGLSGVGIPQRIRDATQAVERIGSALQSSQE